VNTHGESSMEVVPRWMNKQVGLCTTSSHGQPAVAGDSLLFKTTSTGRILVYQATVKKKGWRRLRITALYYSSFLVLLARGLVAQASEPT
jgi:hypothetical protein